MKTSFLICVAVLAVTGLAGCIGGEDSAVKEAPADVQTKSAAEMGGARAKAGEGAGAGGMTTGGERDSRAGG